VELLTDITFDSIFPKNQIEKERNVILEEMSMYSDDPDDSLHDEFDGVVFKGHALGMNILGTEKTVKSFRRKDFRDFINANLDTSRVVFSCVGNVTKEKVVKLAQKYMASIPKITAKQSRKKFSGYKPGEVTLTRPVKQARVAIGRTSYNLSDERRSSFYMLTNILGGPGMNSRLNMALREKYGFVYSIGAQFVPFTDTGLFVLSFGTEPSQMERSVELVKNEMKKLRTEKLGVKQLAAAKEQIMGQIAIAEESNISFMIMMARHLLDMGHIVPYEEMFKSIKNTSTSRLLELANEMFQEKHMSYLYMKPVE
jgi:predicted Zn-dependent peptidase